MSLYTLVEPIRVYCQPINCRILLIEFQSLGYSCFNLAYACPATTKEIDCTLIIRPHFPKSISRKGDILEKTVLIMIFCPLNLRNVLLKQLFPISFGYWNRSKFPYVVRGEMGPTLLNTIEVTLHFHSLFNM